MHKKTGRIRIQTASFYTFFLKTLSNLLHFKINVVIDLYGLSNTYCNDKCY